MNIFVLENLRNLLLNFLSKIIEQTFKRRIHHKFNLYDSLINALYRLFRRKKRKWQFILFFAGEYVFRKSKKVVKTDKNSRARPPFERESFTLLTAAHRLLNRGGGGLFTVRKFCDQSSTRCTAFLIHPYKKVRHEFFLIIVFARRVTPLETRRTIFFRPFVIFFHSFCFGLFFFYCTKLFIQYLY